MKVTAFAHTKDGEQLVKKSERCDDIRQAKIVIKQWKESFTSTHGGHSHLVFGYKKTTVWF